MIARWAATPLIVALLAASRSTAFADPAASIGPSFVCSGSNTRLEGRICADARLSQLDLELMAAHAAALRRSRSALRVEWTQYHWLRDVRGACTTSACLRRTYRSRIAYLDALARRSPESIDLFRYQDVKPLDPVLRKRLEARTSYGCLEAGGERLGVGQGSEVVAVFECGRGMSNGQIDVFLKSAGSYRFVLSINGWGIDVQDERRHGVPRLRVRSHASGYLTDIEFFDFDGARYRPAACGYDEAADPPSRPRERYVVTSCTRSDPTGLP